MARQRVEFGRDPGLTARMLLTLFLLGLLYVALVGVLFASGASGVTIAVIAGALLVGQFFLSDKIGLAAMGAKEVTPEQAPGFHAMIERLCIQADLPKPKIAIADTPMPNAFAIGRSQKTATVCATTGIINALEPHELEAVMAHELTHVKNRDVLIMTIASFFAALASMIVQFGFFFGGGGYDDGDDDNPSWAVVLLVSFVVYILSFFLMLALSRYREYGADRGSALITGRPSALSSALMKISGAMNQVPDQDLRAANNLSAFFIAAPIKQGVATLFMDHPPTEKRIERLQRYEAELQGATAAAA
jgi:heat shock protein HtpX